MKLIDLLKVFRHNLNTVTKAPDFQKEPPVVQTAYYNALRDVTALEKTLTILNVVINHTEGES